MEEDVGLDIFEPRDEDRDPEAEEKMQMGREGNELFDPWFPDAQAALDFPDGEEVPEGMTYEQWKESRA